MAARNRTWTPEVVRQKIRTSMLINRLQKQALGKTDIPAGQQRAIEILLRKTLPDLLGVAHSGSLELTKPEELTDIALANIATGSRYRVIEAPSSEEVPSELH